MSRRLLYNIYIITKHIRCLKFIINPSPINRSKNFTKIVTIVSNAKRFREACAHCAPHTGRFASGGKGGCTERGRNITNAYNAEIMCVCICYVRFMSFIKRKNTRADAIERAHVAKSNGSFT
jgi:hypothetical protein